MFKRLSVLSFVVALLAVSSVVAPGAPTAQAVSSDCQNVLTGFHPGVFVPTAGFFPTTVEAGEVVRIANAVVSGSGTHWLEDGGVILVGPVPLDQPLVYVFPTNGFYALLHVLAGTAVVDITWTCGGPGINVPNLGLIQISAAQAQPAYDGPAGNVLLSGGNPLLLPVDADGNGFDTYTVTGVESVGGRIWLSIFLGSENWGWVPLDMVTPLTAMPTP